MGGEVFLFFKGWDGVDARLWSYDGVNLPSAVPNVPIGSPLNFMIFNSKLLFAGGLMGQYGIWAFDGVDWSGVVDFGRSPTYYLGTSYAVFNNKLYFPVVDVSVTDATGSELWVYDGISPQELLADINTDPYSEGMRGSKCETGCSNPGYLKVIDSKLYFQADDGKHGPELWAYDGYNPPSMVADIHPSGGSYPAEMTVFDFKLLFRARDGINGEELWAYDPYPKITPQVSPVISVFSIILNKKE